MMVETVGQRLPTRLLRLLKSRNLGRFVLWSAAALCRFVRGGRSSLRMARAGVVGDGGFDRCAHSLRPTLRPPPRLRCRPSESGRGLPHATSHFSLRASRFLSLPKPAESRQAQSAGLQPCVHEFEIMRPIGSPATLNSRAYFRRLRRRAPRATFQAAGHSLILPWPEGHGFVLSGFQSTFR
jgi:hypothetical protein